MGGGKSLFLSQLGLVAALLVLMMAPGSSADLVGDACTIDSDCTLNAFCDNLVCACLDNFEADANNHCVDTDECLAETDDCTAANSYCVNEYGSFRCDCMPGYTGDGDVACFNLNECLEPGMNPCSDMAMCYDMDGSYRCECMEGYEGNGYVCTDIDECMTSDAPSCGINAMCVNTPGSVGCECMLGYRGDPETLCEDVDECAWGLDECDKHAMCTNVLGSYECKCMDGYYGDGKMCKDHENPGDLHEADYIHDYPDELGAQHADHDHDELEMALPKIPTEGFEHYHEYYCPLNDDDCGWKPDRSREFCWKIFPHAIHDYHEAYYDCMARSIKGCPARLLPVKDLSAVYYSMTREDVEYCPQELRVDGTVEYDEATGEITYVDGEKMNVKIPMGWTEKPGLADFTNTLEGSLTANLDKKTLIGSVPVEGFFLPMVCQSCVVEIPECPALCDRCNEATTTDNPTSTVTPHFDCNNLDGDMLMTVLGGKDLRTDETLESWRVFDDRYNWCDAQEQFGFFGHGDDADVPAFFRLDQPRYDFGYTSEYNPKRGSYGGPYAYIVIAGGVVTDMETGMEKVTNEVAARYDSSDDDDYNTYHLSRKVEDGKYGAFNDEQYTDSEGNNHTLAVVMDPMVVPRAEFALLGMNAATMDDGYFGYNDYEDEHLIWNLVMAYGGRIDMDGTLTDSIEYRNYDETERDPSDGEPIGQDPNNYDYNENAQLKDDNPNRWVKSAFRLPVPSRTMGVKVHDSLINNPDESTLYNGIREVHMVALVDTSPVQFVTYQMDFRTYQEPRPYDQFRLPELQLDAGELAGFVQSDTYFGVDGPQHLFMAIDTETTTVYTYDFVNNQTWIRHEDAIPEGLTARHLIDTTYYLLQSHHSAVSLLGYSEDEQLSLVKFWQNDTQIFGDNYIEYRLDTTPGANNPELVPFPVKLDLPPMRGAAFGLDATDVGWRRFTTDMNDLDIDPLDDSSLVVRSQYVGASLHTRTKPAAHDSEYVAQAKYHELLRLRHATVDRLHKAVEAKAVEVMTKRMAGMEMDLKLA